MPITNSVVRYVNNHSIVVLFALIFSLLIFIFSPIEPLLYDSALYANIGKNILQDLCYCSNFSINPIVPPVFPFLITIFMILTGDFFVESLLAFLAFLTIVFSYHFILSFTQDKRIALFSSIFFVTTPLFIFNSMRLLTDACFMVFLIPSIWSFKSWFESGKKHFLIICSILTSLTIMTRYVGFLLFAIYILYYMIQRKYSKINVKRLLIMIFLSFLIISPWVIWRTSIESNELKVINNLLSVPGTGHLEFKLESVYFSGEPMNAYPIVINTVIPFQLVNLSRIIISLFVFVTPILSISFLYFLYQKRFFKYDKNEWLMFIWIFGFLLFHIFGFFYFGSRYLIPIILPLAFLFSRIFHNIYKKKKIFAIIILVIHVISIISVSLVDYNYRWSRNNTSVIEDTGLWIKENTGSDVTLLPLGFPHSALSFYSERKILTINDTDVSIVIESNFGFSRITFNEFKTMKNLEFELIKEISDEKYFSRIYRII